MASFDEVWERIVANEGETFTQIRGGQFSYEVRGDKLKPDRTDWVIPKSHLEDAFGMLPLPNTTVVQHLYAPSYIYAILMDERIRNADW